jgi:protein-L-isoaspartate(D-aspartate) O-methyltransferase
VIPIGPDPRNQDLIRLRHRKEGGMSREALGPVRFVPLIGAQGW